MKQGKKQNYYNERAGPYGKKRHEMRNTVEGKGKRRRLIRKQDWEEGGAVVKKNSEKRNMKRWNNTSNENVRKIAW